MGERPAYVLGIDPGLSGALCLLRVSGLAIESIFDMPVLGGQVDAAQLVMIVDMCKVQGTIRAVVELVSSMPRQAGAFNFGRSVGVVHGVLAAMGISYSLTSPNVWKGACGLRRGIDEKQDQVKTRARELACNLWPLEAHRFRRVKDDGRAESSLIARHYAGKMGWI